MRVSSNTGNPKDQKVKRHTANMRPKTYGVAGLPVRATPVQIDLLTEQVSACQVRVSGRYATGLLEKIDPGVSARLRPHCY